jgi:hypothetical protein
VAKINPSLGEQAFDTRCHEPTMERWSSTGK